MVYVPVHLLYIIYTRIMHACRYLQVRIRGYMGMSSPSRHHRHHHQHQHKHQHHHHPCHNPPNPPYSPNPPQHAVGVQSERTEIGSGRNLKVQAKSAVCKWWLKGLDVHICSVYNTWDEWLCVYVEIYIYIVCVCDIYIYILGIHIHITNPICFWLYVYWDIYYIRIYIYT